MKSFFKVGNLSPIFLLVLFVAGACETKNDNKTKIDSLKSLKTLLEMKLDSIKLELAVLESVEPELPPDEKLSYIKPIKLDSIPLPPPPPAEFDDNGPIYIAYDEVPTPIGGYQNLDSKIIYPKEALDAKIQGRVYINVRINSDGNVVETIILKSLSKECDEAAENAIKSIKWNPAKFKSKPIESWVGIPVVFELKNEDKLKSD